MSFSQLGDLHASRIGCVNVNSLFNKVSYIQSLLVSEGLIMLAICETWLVEGIESSYVGIDGFNLIRRDVRGSVRKHGVGLYVSVAVDVVEVDVDVPNVLVVFVPSWGIYVITVYRPPSYFELENEKLRDFISEFCLDKSVLLMGDFNLPSLDWAGEQPVLEQYVSPLDRSFYDVFLSVGLVQLVREQTHDISGNTLDLVLVSDEENVGEVVVLPPLPGCHHCPVLVDVLVPGICGGDVDGGDDIKLWHKGNYQAMSERLAVVDWEVLFEGESVDGCFGVFREVLLCLCNEFVPVRSVSSAPRWIVPPPRALLRQRAAAWAHFKETRSEFGRGHSVVTVAWNEYSRLNREYRNYSLVKQREYEADLVANLVKCPKLFRH